MWGCGVVTRAVRGGRGVWAVVSAVGGGDCAGMYTFIQVLKMAPEGEASELIRATEKALGGLLK